MSKKVYSIRELKRIITKICKKHSVYKVILFGSYAKNEATPTSDIDLVVDSKGSMLNILFYGLLDEIVEKTKKKVDLIEFSEIEKNSEIYENITKEGIVIYEKSRQNCNSKND